MLTFPAQPGVSMRAACLFGVSFGFARRPPALAVPLPGERPHHLHPHTLPIARATSYLSSPIHRIPRYAMYRPRGIRASRPPGHRREARVLLTITTTDPPAGRAQRAHRRPQTPFCIPLASWQQESVP